MAKSSPIIFPKNDYLAISTFDNFGPQNVNSADG